MTIASGSVAKDRVITEVTELTREDLKELKGSREIVTLDRFRDPHHRLARLIASGLRNGELVRQSGYSYNRIGSLMPDPAFQNLIQHYRDMVDEAFVGGVDAYHELATANMLKAERMLAEKLDEADENNTLLPTRDLIAISRDAADRFGYGKKQTNTNINVDFAAILEARIAARRSGPAAPPVVAQVVDARPNPVARDHAALAERPSIRRRA